MAQAVNWTSRIHSPVDYDQKPLNTTAKLARTSPRRHLHTSAALLSVGSISGADDDGAIRCSSEPAQVNVCIE
jgi:hypothetical protein